MVVSSPVTSSRVLDYSRLALPRLQKGSVE
jgi:hypothetical protein